MIRRVYLGLGANLGDRAANLREGMRRLAPDVRTTEVSALYETAPVGFLDQPRFLNAACVAETELGPLALLATLKAVERDLGRVMSGVVWGPRPLDLDILLYEDMILEQPELRIPHPRIAERAFVLRPLADLSPDLMVPGLARTVRDLLNAVDDQDVSRIQGPGWERQNGEDASL